jgi:lipid-A-disaccharide synthase
MLAAAAKVRERIPAVRFHVASFNERQARMVREALTGSGLAVNVHVGRTPEVIESADACMAVSGSVGLELMCRLKPAVVVYKVNRAFYWLADRLMTCEYISLVNLLAGEAIYPEYGSYQDDSAAVAGHVVEWLSHPESRAKVVDRLELLRNQAAVPGACDRAADFLLDAIGHKTASRLRPAS